MPGEPYHTDGEEDEYNETFFRKEESFKKWWGDRWGEEVVREVDLDRTVDSEAYLREQQKLAKGYGMGHRVEKERVPLPVRGEHGSKAEKWVTRVRYVRPKNPGLGPRTDSQGNSDRGDLEHLVTG